MSYEQGGGKSEGAIFSEEWAGAELIGELPLLPLKILEKIIESSF